MLGWVGVLSGGWNRSERLEGFGPQEGRPHLATELTSHPPFFPSPPAPLLPSPSQPPLAHQTNPTTSLSPLLLPPISLGSPSPASFGHLLHSRLFRNGSFTLRQRTHLWPLSSSSPWPHLLVFSSPSEPRKWVSPESTESDTELRSERPSRRWRSGSTEHTPATSAERYVTTTYSWTNGGGTK